MQQSKALQASYQRRRELRQRNAARLSAALEHLGWAKLRLAVYIGERPTIVRNWATGEQGAIPTNVLAWVEQVADPLVAKPMPPEGWRDSPPSKMTGSLMVWMMTALQWDVSRVEDKWPEMVCRTGMTPEEINLRANGKRPIERDLADWLTAVSEPIRKHPMPDGWEPRVVVSYAKGGSQKYTEKPIPGRDRWSVQAAKDAAERAEAEAKRKQMAAERKKRHTPIEARVKAQTAHQKRTEAYHAETAKAREIADPHERRAAMAAATRRFEAYLEKRRAQAHELRQEGWTEQEIAHRLGVTRARVWQMLQQAPEAQQAA